MNIYRSKLKVSGLSLDLYSSDVGLVAIGFGERSEPKLSRWLTRAFPGLEAARARGRHRELERQLTEYFDGRRRMFEISLDLRGTDFQKDVWRAVSSVPYGCTTSYGEIAHMVGRPKASRAVGAANGANPIPLVVPCHRVIGATGSLTGYGGGLPLKRKLLALEGLLPSPSVQMRLFPSATLSA